MIVLCELEEMIAGNQGWFQDLAQIGYRIGGIRKRVGLGGRENNELCTYTDRRPGSRGILFWVASTCADMGGNLVQNGSFETINGKTTTNLDLDFEGGTALTNWTTFASGTSYLDCVANPGVSTATNGLCGNYSFSSTLTMDKTPVASPDGGTTS